MNPNYAYGREEFVFVKKETVMGTYVAPAATDAIQVISTDIVFTPQRKRVPVKTSLRQQLVKVNGRKSGTWSIEKYLLPSGTAGTAPDDTDLWEALMGSITDGASDVVYALTKEPGMSLSILRQFGPHQEAICGAVPGKATISWGGEEGSEPKAKFEGVCYDHYLSGTDALAVAVSAADEIVVVDARQFAVGMLIDVGTDDNTGAGFLIEGIAYATNTLTLNADVASQAEDAVVKPHYLTPTTAGDIMQVINGTVTLGGSGIYLTGGSVEIDNAPKLRNNEYGLALPRGLRYPDSRIVKVSLDMYFERGALAWYNDAKRYTALDAVILLGDVAGKEVQIDLTDIEFDIPSVKIPEADEATISLTGQADGSATGDDEVVVTFK